MPTPRLLLFADTMCSWCYGFQPQMAAVRAHFGDRLDHLTFTGGLRPYTTEPMDAALRTKISSGYARIATASGQVFGARWFEDDAFIYDTEPAARAVVCMRYLNPGADYDYMSAIQRGFYAEGRDITKPDVLAGYAPDFGVERSDFENAFASDEMKEAVRADFALAKRFGIEGFPTLVLHRLDGKNPNALLMVAQGFAMAEEVIEQIEAGMVAEV